MHARARRGWANRRVGYVMRYLRRWSHHDDLVLEKRAVGVIGMPEFGIENFVEWTRFVRVDCTEADHMTGNRTRNIIFVLDFGLRARRKRFINFVAWVRLETYELAGRQTISCSADLSVDRIRKKIYEADTVILQLGWRN